MKQRKQSTYTIEVGGQKVYITRKPIKYTYIRVCPPDGRVCISAPPRVSDAQICAFVASREDFIKRRQEANVRAPRLTTAEIIDSGHMFLWGEKYFLDVRRGAPRNEVSLCGKTCVVALKEGVTPQGEARLLKAFYREQMMPEAEVYIKEWESRMGVKCAEWRLKEMKARWGSCNVKDRRVWLNLHLAQRPAEGLEFIVVHELCHLLERGHNKRFYRYMDIFLPDWRRRSRILNGWE